MPDRFVTYLIIVILGLVALYRWADARILRRRLKEAGDVIEELRFLHGVRSRSEARTLAKVKEMSDTNARLSRALVGNMRAPQRGGWEKN